MLERAAAAERPLTPGPAAGRAGRAVLFATCRQEIQIGFVKILSEFLPTDTSLIFVFRDLDGGCDAGAKILCEIL